MDAELLAELSGCDDHSFIRRAYWVLLGREPDSGGLANYLERLRSGSPKLQVLSELAQSPEGLAQSSEDRTQRLVEQNPMVPAEGPAPNPLRTVTRVAGTLDELLANHGQAFIACAYQTLLGRDPDPDGLRFYLAELRNGFSKIQVLAQLHRSEECRTRFRENRSSPGNREEQVLLAQLQRES